MRTYWIALGFYGEIARYIIYAPSILCQTNYTEFHNKSNTEYQLSYIEL